ncbi:hypothetical protein AWB98_24330 [Mycolicibacterium conceptionense]|uniref:Uncharacterized protein n=1 Tax=Mycolicibacterium conceptionense TaxID=451644 RepID=A0ABX3V225_9MYCO|nr:hypothetical protein [Mycolicibacterium conceptionense]ORV21952.1 hypothetical protein AWB98_24330 [Mycolicibacterium conceptionense]
MWNARAYGLTGIVVTGEPPEPLPLPPPKSPPPLPDPLPPNIPPLEDPPSLDDDPPPDGYCGATVVTGAWDAGCSTGGV